MGLRKVVFNSLTFIVFFVVVLLLHRLPIAWTAKKVNLLVASYVFYAAWNPPFVILLWISSIVDWFIARGIYAARDRSKSRRRAWLMGSIAVNLGFLGFFKYGEFLLQNWQAMMASFGVEYVPPEWNIILPVGISFYTFQTMSYTLDVYLGRSKPLNSFLDFSLFVTFFPQLVAGPIVRPGQLVPQFESPRQATRDQFLWGLGLMILGLFFRSGGCTAAGACGSAARPSSRRDGPRRERTAGDCRASSFRRRPGSLPSLTQSGRAWRQSA